MLKWQFWEAEQKQDYAKCFAIVEELYIKGLSFEDIAHLLDISQNKVKKFLKGSSNKKKQRVIVNAIKNKGKIKNIAKAYVKAKADAQRWRFRYNKALDKVEEYKKQYKEILQKLNKKENYIEVLENKCARMAETNKKNNEIIQNLKRSCDLYKSKYEEEKKKAENAVKELRDEVNKLKKENRKLKSALSKVKKFKLLYPNEAENMLKYYEEDKFKYLIRSLRRIVNRAYGYPLIKDKVYKSI